MLRQVQSQKLLQKLSPQQIQLMKLLQLPTIALEQRIKEEMELNPALEEGEEEEEEDTDLENEFDEETSEEDENQRENFSISDYMDDDEGASYKLKVNNTSPDEERKEIPFSVGFSFQDMLESQLGMKE